MCDKIKKQIEDDDAFDLINHHLPMLLEQTKDECHNCREVCEPHDENEYWQYFVDGYKYCYECWDELELEKKEL